MAKKITKKERKAMRKAEMEARGFTSNSIITSNEFEFNTMMNQHINSINRAWDIVKDDNYFYLDVDLVNKKVSDVKVELLSFPNDLSIRDKEYVLTLASGQPSFYLEPGDILNNAMPIQNRYDENGNTTFVRYIVYPGNGEKALYKVKEMLETATDMLSEHNHLQFVLTD